MGKFGSLMCLGVGGGYSKMDDEGQEMSYNCSRCGHCGVVSPANKVQTGGTFYTYVHSE